MGVYIKIVTHYVFKMLICLLFGTCAFCMESRIKSLMEMHTWNTAKTKHKILEWEATKIKNRTVEDDVILQNEDDEYSILPGRDYTYYWDFSFLK